MANPVLSAEDLQGETAILIMLSTATELSAVSQLLSI
jgi:hypothetical protein